MRNAPDELPRDAAAVLLRREAFDEAARAAGQRGDPAAVAMDLVHAPELVPVERANLRAAQVAEAHHSAPHLGIHGRSSSSARARPSFAALHLSSTALPIVLTCSAGTWTRRSPRIARVTANIHRGRRPR